MAGTTRDWQALRHSGKARAGAAKAPFCENGGFLLVGCFRQGALLFRQSVSQLVVNCPSTLGHSATRLSKLLPSSCILPRCCRYPTFPSQSVSTYHSTCCTLVLRLGALPWTSPAALDTGPSCKIFSFPPTSAFAMPLSAPRTVLPDFVVLACPFPRFMHLLPSWLMPPMPQCKATTKRH